MRLSVVCATVPCLLATRAHDNNELAVTGNGVVTWNLGGDGLSAEFFGSPWQDQHGPVEELLGRDILALTGAKAKRGYSFTRYAQSKSLLQVQEDATVKEYLPFLDSEETQKRFSQISFKRWGCWKDLKLSTILKHAMGGSDSLFEGSDCVTPPKTKTFGAPDACFKLRKSAKFFDPGFWEMAGLVDEGEYWTAYFNDLLASDWGPKKWCTIAKDSKNTKEAVLRSTNLADYMGDWIAMALWDRLVISATRRAHHITEHNPDFVSVARSKEWLNAEGADLKTQITSAYKMLSQGSILLLQEAEAYLEKLDESEKTGRTWVSTPDAAISFPKGLKINSGKTKTATTLLKELWTESSLVGDAAQILANHATPTFLATAAKVYSEVKVVNSLRWSKKANDIKKVHSMWDNLDRIALAVTDQNTLVVSLHSDSDGYFCGDLLVIISMLADRLELTHVLVGMDSNVKADDVRSGEQLGASDLAQIASKLGFRAVNTGEPTVRKQRTFLQAQIAKAGLLDQAMKDVLFVKGEASAVTARAFNQMVGAEVSEMTGPKAAAQLYPTAAWPFDHFAIRGDFDAEF